MQPFFLSFPLASGAAIKTLYCEDEKKTPFQPNKHVRRIFILDFLTFNAVLQQKE